MFDPDKAIESCEEDELNRCKFAKLLGDAIINYEDEESLVIGLLGKWGYGKTSIINMAMEYINEVEYDENPPIVMEFNPWVFSNQNQLIKKFFDELSIKINDEDIKKSLKSYVDKLIPPIIGLASIIDPVRTQALIKNSEYFDDTQSEEESLESIKNGLNDLISKKNQKIIVIIDDIDRLNDFEIQQIFQLVKLLANFPNTVYLLSFDRKVVVNALKGVQKDSSEEYLEKIVQIPFEVPKIHDGDIERLLFNQIAELISEVQDKFDAKHWWNLYYEGMKYFFRSIRDAKRYSNTLKFNFQLIKDEVNIADFLALTCIQVFEPNVYHGIRDNKDLFAGIFNFQVAGATINPQKEQAKKRCDEIIENANESLNEHLKNLLIRLFPKLGALYEPSTYGNYGSDWLKGWRRELRICSPDIFDIYFKFSIPQEELSQGRIESIISLGNDIDSFKESIMAINQEGKITKFFDRMEDYTSEITENDIENIIWTLLDIGDLLDDGYRGFMKPDTQMSILRIIYQLINRFHGQNKRFEVLKSSIMNVNQSIYPIVHEINVLDQEQGKYELVEKPSEPEDEQTVNSEQLNLLENIVCEKIRDWAKRGELLKNRNLDEILFMWQKWSNEKEVNNFVKTAIENDEYLIQFITGFTEKTSTWVLSDHFQNVFWRINLKFMENFINPREIKTRVEKIASSFEFNDLEEDNKRAIQLFLEHIDNY